MTPGSPGIDKPRFDGDASGPRDARVLRVGEWVIPGRPPEMLPSGVGDRLPLDKIFVAIS